MGDWVDGGWRFTSNGMDGGDWKDSQVLTSTQNSFLITELVIRGLKI